MAERIPQRPPPRALHYAEYRNDVAPLCGQRRGRVLHVTMNRTLVTCPTCLAALRTLTVGAGT